MEALANPGLLIWVNNIPDVCTTLGIPWMNRLAMVRLEGWKA